MYYTNKSIITINVNYNTIHLGYWGSFVYFFRGCAKLDSGNHNYLLIGWF